MSRRCWRRVCGDALFDDRAQIDALAHRRVAGFGAREREQLLGEARRARDAALQIDDRLAARHVVLRTRDELRLNLHGGKRRAQLVRGVCDERLLRVERGRQPCKQPVERAHERTHLERQRRIGQRIERLGPACLDCAGHALQRREPAPDDHPDGRAEEGQQHDERPERAQRDARGEPVAHR